MSQDDYINQRQQQILAVQNNPSLTAQQKNDKIMDIANQPVPQPPIALYLIGGAVAIGGLVGLLKWEQARKAKAAPPPPITAYSEPKEAPKKVEKPKKKGIGHVTVYNDPLPVPKAPAPPPAQTVESPMPEIVEGVYIPISQAEVDAIPEEELGMSFFTSRPMPQEALHEVTIIVGGLARIIRATKAEVINCRIGSPPKVRAFDIDGKIVPWYDIADYDPYDDYWAMTNEQWLPEGDQVTATFAKVADLNPSMTGYYGAPMVDNMLAEDEIETDIDIETSNFDYDQFRLEYAPVVYNRPKGNKRAHIGDPFIVRHRREPTPKRLARSIARGAWRAAAKAFHQIPGVEPDISTAAADPVPTPIAHRCASEEKPAIAHVSQVDLACISNDVINGKQTYRSKNQNHLPISNSKSTNDDYFSSRIAHRVVHLNRAFEYKMTLLLTLAILKQALMQD